MAGEQAAPPLDAETQALAARMADLLVAEAMGHPPGRAAAAVTAAAAAFIQATARPDRQTEALLAAAGALLALARQASARPLPP